jgi:hypothetical protein
MNMGESWGNAVKNESKKHGKSFIVTLEKTNATGKVHTRLY